MAQRVLLIGGAGFIGRHLVRECIRAGMDVRVADVVIPVAAATENGAEYLQGDYRSESFLKHILDGVDVVVHLAHDSILLNANNIESEYERNILPAIRLMELCCLSGLEKLLFVSSGGTIYGNQPHKPITEIAPMRPISVYGASKLMIEQIGFLYNSQKNLPFVVARPSNAYGQGQLPFRGQGIVSTAFASALQGKSINIFGDGSVKRDFIHAHDVAEALVAIIKQGKIGEAYNVGTACGISLRGLIEDHIAPLLSQEGYKIICNYEPARQADVTYNVLANDKLRLDTDFIPRVSLDEGMRSTFEWIKKVIAPGSKKW